MATRSRITLMIVFMVLCAACSERTSSAWTSGMPELISSWSWRVKRTVICTGTVVTPPLNIEKRSASNALGLEMVVGRMPWLRSAIRRSPSLATSILPCTFLPERSTPR